MCKQMSHDLCKNCYLQTIHFQIIYLICMYKLDLALNASTNVDMPFNKETKPSSSLIELINLF